MRWRLSNLAARFAWLRSELPRRPLEGRSRCLECPPSAGSASGPPWEPRDSLGGPRGMASESDFANLEGQGEAQEGSKDALGRLRGPKQIMDVPKRP